MAARTGRAVTDVARDSYAVTLFTAWHLSEHDAEQRWLARADRFDLAGLLAQGFHQPKELTALHERFRAEYKADHGAAPDALTPERLARIERMKDALARAEWHVLPITTRADAEG